MSWRSPGTAEGKAHLSKTNRENSSTGQRSSGEQEIPQAQGPGAITKDVSGRKTFDYKDN
ncbi:hypothetical protein Hypma_002918 [Hypsizygus marmoreus]|uniref:Uncharacterized protein n=1 Tax=Hypsizygus marmoreus TaxID=39966 RepID=A0A369J9Z0_HYPMA|nr:hypothetical protein Hypma_002918 [Hypsizygus marmoreus]